MAKMDAKYRQELIQQVVEIGIDDLISACSFLYDKDFATAEELNAELAKYGLEPREW